MTPIHITYNPSRTRFARVPHPIADVFVSPLTRTLDTLSLSCDDTSNLNAPKYALPLLSERLYMVADVGTPRSELESKYSPFVDFRLVEEEEWWWNEGRMNNPESYEEWRPNDKNQQYSVKGEIPEAFKDRMTRLYEFLKSRPEKVRSGSIGSQIFSRAHAYVHIIPNLRSSQEILCVTSWGIISALTGYDATNCEVVSKIDLDRIKNSLKKLST